MHVTLKIVVQKISKNARKKFGGKKFFFSRMYPKDFIRAQYKKSGDIEDVYKKAMPIDDHYEEYKSIVKVLLDRRIDSNKMLLLELMHLRKEYKLVPKHSSLLFALQMEYSNHDHFQVLYQLLVTTKNRSLSGVVVVTVVTTPYPEVDGKIQKFSCAWNCYYCPNEPGQPRSYLHDEPAVIRANQYEFDPVLQFTDRLVTLVSKGHPADKVELIVLGGTWESYPEKFRETFVRDLFFAANTFNQRPARKRLSLYEEQALNETSRCKIIGLTLETRPDTVTTESIAVLRQYGCTRVQLGVQHTDDVILEKINRKCSYDTVKKAIFLLKNACLKVDIHLMPNLPFSSPEKDFDMFTTVLNDEYLQADQWKIYPCEVVPWTVIKKWYDEGSYVPYSDSELVRLLASIKNVVHPWIRLNRVVRDIPSQYIFSGVPIMRDTVLQYMKQNGMQCKCIRCREIRGNSSCNMRLMKRYYKGSGGTEIFLSFENGTYIAGFLRLRLTDNYTLHELRDCAMIRELHVYGQVVPTYENRRNFTQHIGFGKRLMREAEHIAFWKGYSKICVISGVGARRYYEKQGYILIGTYMYKSLGSAYAYAIILVSLNILLVYVLNSILT